MWCNRCYGKEERVSSTGSIVEETVSFRGKDVGSILPSVIHRRVLVPLKGGVQILIRKRIDQKVLLEPVRATSTQSGITSHFEGV